MRPFITTSRVITAQSKPIPTKIYHKKKHKEFNKHKLKRELKKLKESEADKEEIKYVAKLLHSGLKGTEDDSNVNDFYSVDHSSLAN